MSFFTSNRSHKSKKNSRFKGFTYGIHSKARIESSGKGKP